MSHGDNGHRLWHPIAATVLVIILLIPMHLVLLLGVLGLDILTGRVSSAEAVASPKRLLDALVADKSVGLVVGVTATGVVLGYMALRLAGTAAGRPGLASPWRRLRLVSPRGRDVLLACVGLLALSAMLDGVADLLSLEMGGTMELLNDVVAPPWTGHRFVLAAFLGLIPGVAEELYFRGYLLTKLELVRGRWFGLVASALLFGLFHLEPVHSSLTFFMGLYMGLFVLVTGSLWVGMAAHVLNNATAVLLAGSDLLPAVAEVGLGAAVSLAALFLLIQDHGRRWPEPTW